MRFLNIILSSKLSKLYSYSIINYQDLYYKACKSKMTVLNNVEDDNIQSNVLSNTNVLVVDIDGTLLKTDIFLECFLRMLRVNFLKIFLFPFWLLKGRAYVKNLLADLYPINFDNLPVNRALLEWLTEQHSQGRKIYLVSAASDIHVQQVASQFKIFENAWGSKLINLSGFNKLEFIRSQLGNNFCYVANSKIDQSIWNYCKHAVLVGNVKKLSSTLSKQVYIEKTFNNDIVNIKDCLKLIRIHQWSKNLLLFIASFLSANIFNFIDITFVAFISFSLITSSTYIFNDLLDLQEDRLHLKNKNRLIACGKISILEASSLMFTMGFCGLLLNFLLPGDFLTIEIVYIICTVCYSLFLKKLLIVDLITLAGLFTLRIGAGILLINRPQAPWLLGFGFLFFLSLACLKRYIECCLSFKNQNNSIPGRAYLKDDVIWLMCVGITSAFLSLITFFLFLIESNSPIQEYSHPSWMWGVCLIIGYWINRIWLLAGRNQVHADPVLFAIQDRLSLILLFTCLIFISLARC